MITSKDIKSEVENAEKIIKDPKVDVNTKIGVLFTLNTVLIKILVNVRTNTSLIMKHLGISLIKNPTKADDKKEE